EREAPHASRKEGKQRRDRHVADLYRRVAGAARSAQYAQTVHQLRDVPERTRIGRAAQDRFAARPGLDAFAAIGGDVAMQPQLRQRLSEQNGDIVAKRRPRVVGQIEDARHESNAGSSRTRFPNRDLPSTAKKPGRAIRPPRFLAARSQPAYLMQG